MVIRELDNYVEIVAVDRVQESLHSAGDTELSVVISANGFAGQGFAWVLADCLTSFLIELQSLEEKRQGAAVLEGMSPGEFQLRIWSVDRRGHMAVTGAIAWRVYGEEAGPYFHRAEFGFEFDPTLLPGVLSGFRNLIEHTVPWPED